MFKKLSYIFTTRDKIKIGILMVAVVIGSFLELLAVSLFQPFINLIMDTSSLKDSRIMSQIWL